MHGNRLRGLKPYCGVTLPVIEGDTAYEQSSKNNIEYLYRLKMKNRTTFLRWITVMGLALLVSNASAQWKVGVQAGYTHNSLSTESGYAYDRHYDALGGFTVGVPVQYEFIDWVRIAS